MAAKGNFEAVLRLFVNATNTSKKHALTLSIMAIETFAEHGDLSKAQKFLDAMPQNFLRKQAFIAWLVNFAPVKLEKGKFTKDQKRGSMKIDLAAAKVKAFWDFEPEKPIVNYGFDDVRTQVLRLVKRYENSERYKAKEESAIGFVKALETFANTYTPPAASNVDGDPVEGELSNAA